MHNDKAINLNFIYNSPKCMCLFIANPPVSYILTIIVNIHT